MYILEYRKKENEPTSLTLAAARASRSLLVRRSASTTDWLPSCSVKVALLDKVRSLALFKNPSAELVSSKTFRQVEASAKVTTP